MRSLTSHVYLPCSSSSTAFISVEEKQNTPLQNMPLWPKDYFHLIIFERLQTQEKL